MAGREYGALENHLIVAKSSLGLAPPRGDGFGEVVLALDAAHSSTAAAGAGLDHHGHADLLGERDQRGIAIVLLGAGDHRHAGGDRLLARGLLAAEAFHGLGIGPQKLDRCIAHGADEGRVFAEEAVARVDRLGAGCLGSRQDLVDVEVALGRGVTAERHGVIRSQHMRALTVDVAVHGDRLNSELAQSARNADRDFATVGDQDAAERGVFGHRVEQHSLPASRSLECVCRGRRQCRRSRSIGACP